MKSSTKTGIACIFSFAAGALVGVYSTYSYFKVKSEEYVKTEVDNFKNNYRKTDIPKRNEPKENLEPKQSKISIEKTNKTVDDYISYNTIQKKQTDDIVKKEEYSSENDFNDIDESEVENEVEYISDKHDNFSERPYLLEDYGEQFGEFEDYTTHSLTYYEPDDILTDEDDEIIANVDEIIGKESLKYFGLVEPDSIFVRNDVLKCDYEVLKVNEHYESR